MINFFKNLVLQYKFKLILIIIYELWYVLLGYEGNRINILKNKYYSDNIPIPFFFLKKIYLFIKKKKIETVYDLGCGSGRLIFFLSKMNLNLKIFGLENNYKIYKKTYDLFKKNKKIIILNRNILNYSNYYTGSSSSIFYLNDPLKKLKDYNYLFKKIEKNINKKSYLITVNINKKIKVLKKFKIIFFYNIGKEKNIKIYRIKYLNEKK